MEQCDVMRMVPLESVEEGLVPRAHFHLIYELQPDPGLIQNCRIDLD